MSENTRENKIAPINEPNTQNMNGDGNSLALQGDKRHVRLRKDGQPDMRYLLSDPSYVRLRKDGQPSRQGQKKPRKARLPPRSRGKFVPDPMLVTRHRNKIRASFERDLSFLAHEGDIEELKDRLNRVAPKGVKKPKYKPTEFDRAATRCLALLGRTSDDIGKLLGCDGRDIRREYKDELKQGLEIACSLVAGNLFKQALKDSPSAVNAAKEFLTKFGGYVDNKTEISGPGGGPIKSASVQFVMHMHPGDDEV